MGYGGFQTLNLDTEVKAAKALLEDMQNEDIGMADLIDALNFVVNAEVVNNSLVSRENFDIMMALLEEQERRHQNVSHELKIIEIKTDKLVLSTDRSWKYLKNLTFFLALLLFYVIYLHNGFIDLRDRLEKLNSRMDESVVGFVAKLDELQKSYQCLAYFLGKSTLT